MLHLQRQTIGPDSDKIKYVQLGGARKTKVFNRGKGANGKEGIAAKGTGTTSAAVSGSTKSVAVADIKNDSRYSTATAQSQADIFGLPDQCYAQTIVSDQPHLSMYLGVPASSTFVALGFLGGAHPASARRRKPALAPISLGALSGAHYAGASRPFTPS